MSEVAGHTDEGPVFVLVEVTAVRDPETYKAYQLGARAQIGPRGGVVLARGGQAREGTPPFGPVLLQRWPSRRAFVEWQESEDYRPLKAMRLGAVDLRITIVPALAG